MAEASVTLSVILPVHNERWNLHKAYRELCEVFDRCPELDWYELVFIDDGSTDGSWPVCIELAQSDARLRCLKLASHAGQQAALCAGLESALGELLLTCDVDLQVHAADLPRLCLTLLEGHDMVRAWRRSRAHASWARRWLSHAASRFFGLMLRQRQHDFASSYVAVRRSLAQSIVKSGVRRHSLGITAVQLATSVVEIPVDHQPRHFGTSRYTGRKLLELGTTMLAACFPRLARQLTWLAALVAGLSAIATGAFLVTDTPAPAAVWGGGLGCAMALSIAGSALLLHRKRAALLKREQLPFYEVEEIFPTP